MSKMFETLGPLGLKWCFSKITDPKIIIFELKKQKKKKDGEINPKKKKGTYQKSASGILFKIE